MTEWFAGLCPHCLSGIGEAKLSTPRWADVIRCGKCKKETYPIVAVRLLNEAACAGMEEVGGSEAVIKTRGKEIRMKSIRQNFEIVPKSPFPAKLTKVGLEAIKTGIAEDLKMWITKNTGTELDYSILLQIIACCYKNGMKTGEIAVRKISESDLGKEITIFNSHMSGEGNSFIALGNMSTRSQQVLPGFPLKLFGTIRKTPSVLLFFRYFSALYDPEYNMSQNQAVLFIK